jgi:hypothetical protein
MNEALILERLDRLSAEMKTMKMEVLDEVRQELAPLQQASRQPAALTALLSEVDDPATAADIDRLVKTLLHSLEELSEAVEMIKAGVQLKQDLGPIIEQAYPKSIQLLAEIDGDFRFDELTILLRKTITNLDNIGEGIDLLRAGVELRDELVPILQLMYPRLLRFLNSLHEGEFQAEKLGDLLHTILINIHTLSDLLNMIQPMTEFVKEFGVVLKETDIVHGVNLWLDGLQQGSGLVKLAGTVITFLRRIDCNERQIDEICRAIETIDFSRPQRVSALGIVKQLNDPKVQEAIGFMFMMLRAMGSCLQSYQNDKEQRQPA